MNLPMLTLSLVLSCAVVGRADVHYVEEVTSSALGQTDEYKTINQVYIKGMRQKIHSRIDASKKAARTLEKQGQSLDTSTILRLDAVDVHEIDHVAQTYVRERLPAAKLVAAKPTPQNPNAPVVKFRVKSMPDTKRIEGILCQRWAADMRARYYEPGTRQVKKENRYLYQAWIAEDFPGYEEIQDFQELQARRTSYPSLISGGLEQLRETVEDYDQLAAQMDSLKGFPMQSVLTVYVSPGGKKKKQIFQLTRTIKSLSYSPLSDTLFLRSKGLKKIVK